MKPPSVTKSIQVIILTGLGYWLMGKAGLMLAIPPGYATAVWPAAGVAFAALMVYGVRHWPGVFLGSFAVNIGVGLDSSTLLTILQSIAIAGGIGLGAALQASVAVFMVRRWVGEQPALDAPGDVVLFMSLAGPLACTLNAINAQIILFSAGVISFSELPFSTWVWWTGDVMGVVVMAPLLMAFLAKPEAIWRQRRWTVVVPLLAIYAVLVAGFFVLSDKEQGRLQRSFQKQAKVVLHGVSENLKREMLFVDALAAQVADRGQVTAGEWSRMQQLLEPYRPVPGGVAWLQPEDEHDSRSLLHARIVGKPGPQQKAGTTPCADLWSEIATSVEVAGYPQLLEAMQIARATGKGALSSPMSRHSSPLEQSSCVAYVSPVFHGAPQTVEERRAALIGFTWSIQSVSKHLLSVADSAAMAVQVTDSKQQDAFAVAGQHEQRDSQTLRWQGQMALGQRSWIFEFQSSPRQVARSSTWQAWLALAGGLIMTSVFGMFLMVVGGQAARVRVLVNERTQALAEANINLQHAVQRNSTLVEELQHTNKELEQFAYVASHDLREPLRTIESFARLLEASNPDARSEDEKTFLRFITEGVGRMQSLIEDLLQYSRVGRSDTQLQLVDLNTVLENVKQSLQRSIEESNAVIRIDSLPTVLGDPVQLGQVFQNILSNSLKYRGERGPEITIQVEKQATEWEIRCRDNGIGFDPAKAALVFEPFKRLHQGGHFEGTGIGMAIVAKIIRQMGGRIRADAVEGEGATIILHLPVSVELAA